MGMNGCFCGIPASHLGKFISKNPPYSRWWYYEGRVANILRERRRIQEGEGRSNKYSVRERRNCIFHEGKVKLPNSKGENPVPPSAD